MKYVSVLASSFSGSTLLSMLLSTDSRVISFGDTYPVIKLAERGGYADMQCTCGAPILQCPLRRELEQGMRARGFPNYRWIESRAIPKVLGRGARSLKGLQAVPDLVIRLAFRRFFSETEAYLDCLHDIRDFSVYVDGCKSLTRLELMMRSQRKLKVIHLLKDPRGVIYSYLKHARENSIDPEQLVRKWFEYNDQAHAMCHRLGNANFVSIAYSELVRGPRKCLQKISEMLGLSALRTETELIDTSQMHIVGNKMRLAFSSIEDRSNEWRGRLDDGLANMIVERARRTEWAAVAIND